jgi:hypothetical protein
MKRSVKIKRGLSPFKIVPPDKNPQQMVDDWSSLPKKSALEFAKTWRPNGPNDYKQTSPMYDAYGNYEYGATGAAAGFSDGLLQGMGDLIKMGKNNPINRSDIQSGFDAISNGGKLSTIEYTPPTSELKHPAASYGVLGGWLFVGRVSTRRFVSIRQPRRV